MKERFEFIGFAKRTAGLFQLIPYVHHRTDLRDELKDYLASNQVETAIHYPVPIHLQPAATKFGYRSGSFLKPKQASQMLTSIHQFLSEAQILLYVKK